MLSRKLDERIMVGSDVVITVISIGDGKVRLGIAADPSIPVHREEVAERMEAERQRKFGGGR